MAIDYIRVRQEISTLNGLLIKVGDALSLLEKGRVLGNGVPLTPEQIISLTNFVKELGVRMEGVVGEIEALLSN